MNSPEMIYWVTVAAYFVTAVICALCALLSDRREIWWGFALGMLLLMINKKQDLLGSMTALGRSITWRAEWYAARGSIQILIIVGIVVLAGFLLTSARWFLRPLQRVTWLGLAGVIFLPVFAATRAVSLHQIDIILFSPVAGIYLNWVIELGGIALIAFAALVMLLRARREGRKRTGQHLEMG